VTEGLVLPPLLTQLMEERKASERIVVWTVLKRSYEAVPSAFVWRGVPAPRPAWQPFEVISNPWTTDQSGGEAQVA